jgi:transcriptional regulator with XRE-family HTH domain
MTRLGKEIKKARIEKALSQSALEALTGINFRHLSAIERGDIDPRWSTLVKLSIALDPYLMLDRVAWDTHREEHGLYEEDARHA